MSMAVLKLTPKTSTPPYHFAKKLKPFSASLAALSSLLLLCGCVTNPSQIAEPNIKIKNDGNAKADYSIDGNIINYGTTNYLDSEILPFETTRSGLLSQIMAFRGAYNKRTNELLANLDVANNTQFLGILVSAAGVALSDNSIRNTGAGVAGLSALWSSHYSIALQAKNYATAVEALDCMYRAIDEVPQSLFDDIYIKETGQLKFSKEELSKTAANNSDSVTAIKSAYDSLSSVFRAANSNIYNIHQKLRRNQAALIASSASLSDLKSAISSVSAATANAEKQATEITSMAKPASGEAGNVQQLANANKLRERKTQPKYNSPNIPINQQPPAETHQNPIPEKTPESITRLQNTPVTTLKVAINLPSALSTCTTVATGSAQ